MKTRTAVILSAIVLLLTACKPKDTPVPDSAAELQPVEQLTSDMPFWHPFPPKSAAGEFIEDIVSEYNQSQTEYRVLSQSLGSCESILQKFEESSASGNPPAIVWVCTGADSGFQEAASPVSYEAILGDAAAGRLFDRFDPALLEPLSSENGTVAVPFNLSAPVLVYRTELFRESGLDSEFVSRSWLNLIDAAFGIYDIAGVPGLTLGLDPAWTLELLIATQGGTMLDESGDPVFNNTDWLNGLYMLADVYAQGAAILSRSPSEAAASLESGRVGMAVIPNEWADEFAGDEDYGFAAWPQGSTLPGDLPVSGGSLYITAVQPQKQQATGDFVLFMMNDSRSSRWAESSGMLPAFRDGLEAVRRQPPSIAAEVAMQFVDEGSPQTDYGMPHLEIQDIFNITLEDMLANGIPAGQAVTEAFIKIHSRLNP
jgi:multiple sugar transport system substrate-binding protein